MLPTTENREAGERDGGLAPAITIQSHSWRDWATVAAPWDALVAQADASFFLSAHWVGAWLETFGEQLRPEILLFHLPGTGLAGGCLLVRRVFKRGAISLRRVYLNCAGEDEVDQTHIEYNRLLCLPAHARPVAAALAQFLSRERWDELALFGAEPQEALAGVWPDGYVKETTPKPCWYVDLAGMREQGATYENVLSHRSWRMIQRSLRSYEESRGPLVLERAGTPAEALDYLNQLAELHREKWTGRGKPGVFSSDRFCAFHRLLIERAFPDGPIELVRVLSAGRPAGVLYGFLSRGRLHLYQCGFGYEGDNVLSPGMVTHFVAVRHYLQRPDVLEYGFPAGDSPYERSLGNSQRILEWRIVQRPTLRVRTLRLLSSVKHADDGKRSGTGRALDPASDPHATAVEDASPARKEEGPAEP